MLSSHRVRRGRGFGSGLVVLFAAACAGGEPGPVGEPIEGYTPPVVEISDGSSQISNAGAAQRLALYETLPSRNVTLLFLGGRSATPLQEGGSAWADMDGGRIVRFDDDGVVREVLNGAPEGGPPLTQPAFVARDGNALLAVDLDGQALRFLSGKPEAWVASPLPGGAVGGGTTIASTRTVFDIQIAPVPPNAPLLWTRSAGETRPMGTLHPSRQALLSGVVNAGWVAPAPDGGVYYASAVRPELHRYAADGTLEWVSTWARDGVREPTFAAVDGTLTPKFRLIQQAIAVGPDKMVYLLVTTGDRGPADRLLTFDSGGSWVGDATVSTDAAIYVGRKGHLYRMAPDDALARTEAESRTASVAFEPFDLPALVGEGDVRLEDHRGKVVVVNFWASWCVPCRREMPLLNAFAGELDPEQAVMLGLNEDATPDDGRAFLEEIGGVDYPVAEGRGRLRAQYGYRGLPYTVVLDREGKLVKAFYGFGESIDPIKEATRAELAKGS